MACNWHEQQALSDEVEIWSVQLFWNQWKGLLSNCMEQGWSAERVASLCGWSVLSCSLIAVRHGFSSVFWREMPSDWICVAWQVWTSSPLSLFQQMDAPSLNSFIYIVLVSSSSQLSLHITSSLASVITDKILDRHQFLLFVVTVVSVTFSGPSSPITPSRQTIAGAITLEINSGNLLQKWTVFWVCTISISQSFCVIRLWLIFALLSNLWCDPHDSTVSRWWHCQVSAATWMSSKASKSPQRQQWQLKGCLIGFFCLEVFTPES